MDMYTNHSIWPTNVVLTQKLRTVRSIFRPKRARAPQFGGDTTFFLHVKNQPNYEEAVLFDKRKGNTKWQDATALEMKQLNGYSTFIDRGIFSKEKIPTGIKKITVHLIFNMKHDSRHKAQN